MASGSHRTYDWTEITGDDDDRERWRHASLREKGEALIDLLGLVDAIGRYPEPTARWPGFPKRRPARSRGGE